jgi:K+ transporter
LVLTHPQAVESPFFQLFPGWMLYPITVLATAATVIASQAVISGAFSLSQQAMQLSLPDLALWREKLFIFMTRNAVSASEYFQIPPKRVVELGTQVEL